ncbi:sterol desaturase [Asaia krungthepensis NRIC 0535]|uniref:Sterol desaturase n=2 Tax=Asaia krungthepensis TaxID=220990 RepID=A0ABQ0Q2U5_9PROT|nr:sterol desaturase [Asaia krungthepensis NRIC 0535]
MIAGGLVVWFIFEYVMHRFLFHLKSGNRHIDALVWMMHTNHHIQPSHRLRTLMPLSVSLPLAALFELGAIAVFGLATGTALMAGFVLGYFIYDLTHYACHNFEMKSPWAARVKRHHLKHHYVSDEHNFSITVPFIDSLFSTRD